MNQILVLWKIIWNERIMLIPSKWTPVKDYFKSPYSLTFGSDLFVPKQDFLLLFSPECCFVLGIGQFPLVGGLTPWKLLAMMCPSQKCVRLQIMSLTDTNVTALCSVWWSLTMTPWQNEPGKGWNNVQVHIAILNINTWFIIIYHHDFSRHFPITLFHLSRKSETTVFIQSSSSLLISCLASHHFHCPSKKTILLEELQLYPILSG